MIAPAAILIGAPTRLDFWPHPITSEGRHTLEVAGGQTLEAAIGGILPPFTPAEALINGRRFARSEWRYIVLTPNDQVSVRAVVQGGGRASDVLQIVLTIGVIVAAPYLGAGLAGGLGLGSAGAAVLTTAVALGGLFVVNSLFPPRLPIDQERRQFSVAGGSNPVRPYEPCLLVLGEHRLFPDIESKPYTEFDSESDQFLGQIFDWGIGDLAIGTVHLGETEISDFENVETEAGVRLVGGKRILDPLVSGNVDTIEGGQLGYEMGETSTITRTTAGQTTKLAVDLMAVHYHREDGGDLRGRRTVVRIRFRRANDPGASWTEHLVRMDAPDGERARQALRRSFTYTVAADEYDVEVRAATRAEDAAGIYPAGFDFSDEAITVALQLVAIRAYQDSQADFTGRNPLAVRIKATGQLYGRIERLNAVVGQRIPAWDGSTWTTEVSGNAGDVALAWMRGFYDEDARLIAGMGLADEKIHLASVREFIEHCTINDFDCNLVLSDARDPREVLGLILQCGWGSSDRQSGKWGILWEDEGRPRTAVITPASTIAGSLNIRWDHENLADEITGTFLDSANDYQPTPIRRLLPGVTSPVNPAQINLEGITDGDHAAKAVNQMVAANRYHRRMIAWEMRFEESRYIARGDVVGVANGLLGSGEGGRFVAISSDRTRVTPTNLPETQGSVWIWDLNGDVVERVYTLDDDVIVLASALPDPPSDGADDPLAYRYMAFPANAPPIDVRITAKEPAGEGRFRFIARDEVSQYYDHRTADLDWVPVVVPRGASSRFAAVGAFVVTANDLGVRIFSWAEHESPDIIGYQLRYGPLTTGGQPTEWSAMDRLHDGILSGTYLELLDRPELGDWRFGISGVLNDGRLTLPSYAEATLEAVARGFDGTDGQGLEHVFVATADPTLPGSQRPSDTWGFDEPGTVGGLQWHDGLDGTGFGETLPYLWRAERRVPGTPATGADVAAEWIRTLEGSGRADETVDSTWGMPEILTRWGTAGLPGVPGAPGLDGIPGADAEDGQGVEYIFAVTDSETAPSSPSNSWGFDEPVSPWFDGAPSLTETDAFLWRSTRPVPGDPSVGTAVSASWTPPRIVGRYGEAGRGTEYIFAIADADSVPVSQRPLNSWDYGQPQSRDGLQWEDDAPNADVDSPYLFRSQRSVPGSPAVGTARDPATWGTWTVPKVIGISMSADASRGSGWYRVAVTAVQQLLIETTGVVLSSTLAALAEDATPGGSLFGDIVTFFRADTSFSSSWGYTGADWRKLERFIGAELAVFGTLSALNIKVTDIDIEGEISAEHISSDVRNVRRLWTGSMIRQNNSNVFSFGLLEDIREFDYISGVARNHHSGDGGWGGWSIPVEAIPEGTGTGGATQPSTGQDETVTGIVTAAGGSGDIAFETWHSSDGLTLYCTRRNSDSFETTTFTAVYGIGDPGSEITPPDDVAPSVPALIVASVTDDTEVTVVWNSSTAGHPTPTYRLQRATDSGFTSGLVTLVSGLTSLSFVDSGLIAGTTYHYRVRGENSSGDSRWTCRHRYSYPRPSGNRTRIRITSSSSRLCNPGTPSGGEALLNHTPTGWSRTEPDPTATMGVWQVERTRMFDGCRWCSVGDGVGRPRRDRAAHADEGYTDTDYAYQVSAGSPGTPSGGTSTENHTPTGWTRSELTANDATATEGVWQCGAHAHVRRRRHVRIGDVVDRPRRDRAAHRTAGCPNGIQCVGRRFVVQRLLECADQFRVGRSTDEYGHRPSGGSWVTAKRRLTANDLDLATDGRVACGAHAHDFRRALCGCSNRRIRLRNGHGLDEIHPSPLGTPPGAPTGFNVSAGASSFSGSWNAPTSFEGSLSYEYGYRPSGGSWVNGSTSSTSFSVSHTSFTDGASYEFRVRSVDDNGESGYVTDTATVPLAVPGPVRNLGAEDLGRGRGTSGWMSWIAPNSGGPVDQL